MNTINPHYWAFSKWAEGEIRRLIEVEKSNARSLSPNFLVTSTFSLSKRLIFFTPQAIAELHIQQCRPVSLKIFHAGKIRQTRLYPGGKGKSP